MFLKCFLLSSGSGLFLLVFTLAIAAHSSCRFLCGSIYAKSPSDGTICLEYSYFVVQSTGRIVDLFYASLT